MATASVTVRVDAETKAEAARIAEDFGFDLSSVTRAFYRQIAREQRIPLTLEYSKPNDESRSAVAEAREIIEQQRPRFSNAEEMFKALDLS